MSKYILRSFYVVVNQATNEAVIQKIHKGAGRHDEGYRESDVGSQTWDEHYGYIRQNKIHENMFLSFLLVTGQRTSFFHYTKSMMIWNIVAAITIFGFGVFWFS